MNLTHTHATLVRQISSIFEGQFISFMEHTQDSIDFTRKQKSPTPIHFRMQYMHISEVWVLFLFRQGFHLSHLDMFTTLSGCFTKTK